jgi:transposase
MGIRAICRELGVSRKAVRQALRRDGPPTYTRPPRPNAKLAPFEAQIRAWYFGEKLIGSRIIRELEARGYDGHRSAVYRFLEKLRAAVPSSKVTARFETPPGQQGQFDWSPYTVELGGDVVRALVYGLTLGYSRRKHYTASLDETQASIFEALESCLRHFGGSPKQLLVDNAQAFVLDAHPARFRWNPQFLALCGHYRLQPRACQPYRARTKGKVERPFFYLEQQFIKGRRFASFQHFLEELAAFEREDLDVRVHTTTQERPIDRFQQERPHLLPLPAQPFVGTLALSRQVSWGSLVSYGGSRYSVPAPYAGKRVWVLPSRGTHVRVLDAQRTPLAEHALSPAKGALVIQPEHYAPLRRTTARTYVVLAEQFLRQFPQQAAFLDGLLAQPKLEPTRHLHGLMELASLYDAPSLEQALRLAQAYNTYSASFVRGLLEHGAAPRVPGTDVGERRDRPRPAAAVQADLGRYQRGLEGAR